MKLQQLHYININENHLNISTDNFCIPPSTKKIVCLHHLYKCFITVLLAFIVFIKTSSAQEKIITGTVNGLNGEPLVGATITVKGAKISVKTNTSGAFVINVPQKYNTIIASFVEHQTKEVEIKKNGIVNIVLLSLTSDLDSVVVVGYGTQKRSDVTGAISSVSGC